MPIDINQLSPQEQITSIYISYYNRAPDALGLEFWTGQLDDGMSLEEIATTFSSAAETIGQFPFFDPNAAATSPDDFLTSVYNNLFGRDPDFDGEGFAFWSDELASGSTPVGEIILAIAEGAQDVPGGAQDLSTLENKIEVGADWAAKSAAADIGTTEDAAIAVDNGNGTFTVNNQAAFDSASTILDDVDGTEASVTAAKDATAAFIGGGTPPVDTFTLTTSADAVDEGDAVTFTLAGEAADAGKDFAYVITGVDSDDIDGNLVGSLKLDSNGEALLNVRTVADEITEGEETLTLSVNGKTADVTVNDTSLTPSPETPSFTLTSSAAAVDEGDAVTFTLATENVDAGSTFNYQITGVSGDDIDGSLTGSVTLDSSGEALIDVGTVADGITEGEETLTLSVAGETADVMVNDTSLTPPEPESFTLTAGVDEATNDQFEAPRVSNDEGVSVNSLNDDDVLAGEDDNPTLNFSYVNDDTRNPDFNITPTLNGIETINVSYSTDGGVTPFSLAGAALDVQDSSGVDQVNLSRIESTLASASIANMPSVPSNFSINNTQAQATTVNLTFLEDAVSGDSDSSTLTLNDATVAGVVFQEDGREPGAIDNGVETLNIDSVGDTNVLNGVLIAEDLQTLNISGDQKLTIESSSAISRGTGQQEATLYGASLANVAGSLTAVDASGMSAGGLEMTFGGELNVPTDAGTGGQVNMNVTGSSADDIIRIAQGAGIDAVANNVDTFDLGDGEDTLYLSGVQDNVGAANNAIAVQPNGNPHLLGIEKLDIRTGHDPETPPAPVVGDNVTVNANAFDSLGEVNVRNEGAQDLLPLPLFDGAAESSVAENMNVTLNNLGATAAANVTLQHGQYR